jgi:hypothetical protein
VGNVNQLTNGNISIQQSRDHHPKGKFSKKKKNPLAFLKSRIKFGGVRKELLNACSGDLGKQVEYFSKV